MNEKIPQSFFLGSGKDDPGVRIELLGREHGGDGIIIRIHMTGNDGFGSTAFFFGDHNTTPVEIEYRMIYKLSVYILQMIRPRLKHICSRTRDSDPELQNNPH
jgi:hypothetical protein